MIEKLKNWWRGRYWQLEYNDGFAHEIYVLPGRYYSRTSAERAAKRMTKGMDWANVTGPFKVS
jgi:hypothetical protein